MIFAIFSKDRGGTSEVLPVGKILENLGHSITYFCQTDSVGYYDLREAGVNVELVAPGAVPSNMPFDAVIVSLCRGKKEESIMAEAVAKYKDKCPILAVEDFWGQQKRWIGQILPDYLFANDKFGKRITLDLWQEFPINNIFVLGYPDIDKFSNVDFAALRQETRRKHEIPDNQPVILFAGQSVGTAQALEMALQALWNSPFNEGLGSWSGYFLWKPHQTMMLGNLSPEFQKEKELCEMVIKDSRADLTDPFGLWNLWDLSSENILPLIAASDLVISGYSTALRDACIVGSQIGQGKANISIATSTLMEQLETGAGLKEMPTIGLGCTAKASDQDELVELLKKWRSGSLVKEQAPFQKKRFIVDGKNAQRVANKIIEIVGNK